MYRWTIFNFFGGNITEIFQRPGAQDQGISRPGRSICSVCRAGRGHAFGDVEGTERPGDGRVETDLPET